MFEILKPLSDYPTVTGAQTNNEEGGTTKDICKYLSDHTEMNIPQTKYKEVTRPMKSTNILSSYN